MFLGHFYSFVDVRASCSQVTAYLLRTIVLPALVYGWYYPTISLSALIFFVLDFTCVSNIVYPSRRIQEPLPSHLSSTYYSIYSSHKICLLLKLFYALKLHKLRKCDFSTTFRRQCTKTQLQQSSTEVINWKYWKLKLRPKHSQYLKALSSGQFGHFCKCLYSKDNKRNNTVTDGGLMVIDVHLRNESTV